MSKQPKPKEATCTFDRIEVQLGVHGRMMVVEPSKSRPSILVEPKLIWVGGKTKLAWKKLKSVQIANDGFMIESEQHIVHVFGLHDKNWPLFQKLLEKYWQRQLTARARKSEEQKQQEDEERRLKKKSYSRSYTPRFSNKGAKFLSRNEDRNNWDSSDDEETFNLQRPKRKPLEEEEEEPTSEPVDNDVDMQLDDAMDEQNQEQAMEDAAADAELKEREEQEEQEEAADSEAEQVKMPKKKKLKRKRVQDDDSDDEVFGAEMTTPNPQSRTVSPHTIAKNRFADDDDDDDDENDAPQETKKVAPKKTTTTTTKTVTPTLHSFFSRPTKKTNTAAKEEAAAPPAVKRKPANAYFFNPKKASKVASPAAQDPLEDSQSTVVPSQTPTADDPLEDSQSTVVPSQTPTVLGSQESSTVVPSQTPTVIASQESSMSTPATTDLNHPSTPTRKIEFPKSTSSKKKTTIDEEDTLVDSPQQSSRPQVTTTIFSRRKPMLGPRRTYGSSGKKDKASMALEFADANQSPKPRQLALALSSPTRINRFTKRAEYSPSRSLSPKRSRFWKPRDSSPTRSPTKSPMATDSDPLPVPDFRGIKNIGNTCYMNSSLQMLYSVPSFAKQLTQASSNVNEHSVVSSIVQLFSELNQVQRTPASARNLKMAVDNKTNKFQGYQQRDANEFLGDLLDTMHDELVDADGKQEEEKKVEQQEETVYPTDNFFRMDVEVCLKCKSCGYSRTKEEMYRYLSLDILQKGGEETSRPNIEECLQAFFQPEDREIKCEKCEDGLVAEQTMKILSKPKAILLHLKRFAMVEQPGKDDNPPTFVLRKNKAPVELSKTLSLDPFIKENADTKQEYKIQSIVHHIGTTADSGHYTADALREDPKDSSTQTWVSFDDTLVERVSEADVLEDKPRRRTAYMMLYTLA